MASTSEEDYKTLMEASETGDLVSLKNLVSGLNGRVIEQDDVDIALFVAATEGKKDICKYLIVKLRADKQRILNDRTVLIASLSRGHVETSCYLVREGVDPRRCGPSRLTPLHYAARIGDVRLLKLLLSKGVDVDAPSPTGTPMLEAIGKGKPEAVRALLEGHADPNLSVCHITPLAASVCARSTKCIEILANAGAVLNDAISGMRPLQFAVDIRNVEIVRCLLEKGANPNVSNEGGMRPLLMAVERKNVEIIRCLLQFRADPNFVNEEGMKAIEVAILRGYREGFDALQPCTLMDPKKLEWSSEEQLDESQREDRVLKLFQDRYIKGYNASNRKEYYSAVFWYALALNDDDGQIIVHSSSRAMVHSNRSLCYLQLGINQSAIRDAIECWYLDCTCATAYLRLGSALMALKKFSAAVYAFSWGLELDPHDEDLLNAIRSAIDEGQAHDCKEDPRSFKVFLASIEPYIF